jgi:hypothetical protein
VFVNGNVGKVIIHSNSVLFRSYFDWLIIKYWRFRLNACLSVWYMRAHAYSIQISKYKRVTLSP